mgnify:FL=1
MAKAKNINIYKIFSETYDRSMFGFMGLGELKLMTKVKTVRQTTPKVSMGTHVDCFLKSKHNLKVVK